MLRSLRSLLFTVPLLGVCACFTPFLRRAPPEGAVTLRFAWPETLSVRVSHTVLLSGSRGQRTYWWKVMPGPAPGQRRLGVLEGESPEPGVAAIADPEISLLFDSEGNFLEADPPEDAPALSLLNALPLNAEQQAEVRERLTASLRNVAQGRWEQRVTHWRGLTLAPQEPVQIKTRMWVGQSSFEREELEADERTTIEVDVACSEDVPDKRCVRLVVETVPIREYKESEPCARARARRRFELVTDPHTLLPYFTRAVRQDQMDWCREDGTVATRDMSQGEEFVFTYGLEPVPTGTWSRR